MNVHPQHYVRIIKATYWVLVCRYSNSVVLSTGDHCWVLYTQEREEPLGGAREGQQDRSSANTTSEGKISALALFHPEKRKKEGHRTILTHSKHK